MELSNEEQALIKAFREGADVHVSFHNCQTVDEAIERINIISDVKGINDYGQISKTIAFSNFDVNDRPNIGATAFISWGAN